MPPLLKRKLAASPQADAILQAARQGDLRAINRLVAAHEAAVYNLAYQVLGDEAEAARATEAAFVSAMRELRSFRDGSLQVWVLRWLVQACRPVLSRHPPLPAGHVPGSLAGLPTKQRLVLALVDIARLDYAQAAAVLGRSAAQVRGDLAAARRAVSAAVSQTGSSDT